MFAAPLLLESRPIGSEQHAGRSSSHHRGTLKRGPRRGSDTSEASIGGEVFSNMRSDASVGHAMGHSKTDSRKSKHIERRPSNGSQVSSASPGRLTLRGPSEDQAGAPSAPKIWPPDMPWKGVCDIIEARKHVQVAPRSTPSVFGASALQELLARAAFTYLEAYGNTRQRSMTAQHRAVWLLTYLNGVSHFLRQSMMRHCFGEDAEHPESSQKEKHVEKMLNALKPETWQIPPPMSLPEAEDGRVVPFLPATTIREPVPQPPEELRLPGQPRKVERVPSGPPVGAPCVADQACRCCKETAGPSSWGNPRCLGCSSVDVVPFKCHPLSGLLIDQAPDFRFEVLLAEPISKVLRCTLTPPPLRPSDAFRLDEKKASLVRADRRNRLDTAGIRTVNLE